jgi:hypothetical protein
VVTGDQPPDDLLGRVVDGDRAHDPIAGLGLTSTASSYREPAAQVRLQLPAQTPAWVHVWPSSTCSPSHGCSSPSTERTVTMLGLTPGLHSSRHSAIADWQLRGDGSLEGA